MTARILKKYNDVYVVPNARIRNFKLNDSLARTIVIPTFTSLLDTTKTISTLENKWDEYKLHRPHLEEIKLFIEKHMDQPCIALLPEDNVQNGGLLTNVKKSTQDYSWAAAVHFIPSLTLLYAGGLIMKRHVSTRNMVNRILLGIDTAVTSHIPSITNNVAFKSQLVNKIFKVINHIDKILLNGEGMKPTTYSELAANSNNLINRIVSGEFQKLDSTCDTLLAHHEVQAIAPTSWFGKVWKKITTTYKVIDAEYISYANIAFFGSLMTMYMSNKMKLKTLQQSQADSSQIVDLQSSQSIILFLGDIHMIIMEELASENLFVSAYNLLTEAKSYGILTNENANLVFNFTAQFRSIGQNERYTRCTNENVLNFEQLMNNDAMNRLCLNDKYYNYRSSSSPTVFSKNNLGTAGMAMSGNLMPGQQENMGTAAVRILGFLSDGGNKTSYITILGRRRKLIKQGRKHFVMVNKVLTSLSEAKKLDKQLSKKTNKV